LPTGLVDSLRDVVQSRFHIGGTSGGIALACETQQAVHNAFHATRFVGQLLNALGQPVGLNFFAEKLGIPMEWVCRYDVTRSRAGSSLIRRARGSRLAHAD
jgi:hypothetical protein